MLQLVVERWATRCRVIPLYSEVDTSVYVDAPIGRFIDYHGRSVVTDSKGRFRNSTGIPGVYERPWKQFTELGDPDYADAVDLGEFTAQARGICTSCRPRCGGLETPIEMHGCQAGQ